MQVDPPFPPRGPLDTPEPSSVTPASAPAPVPLQVLAAETSFDLDRFASLYQGRTKAVRLNVVAERSLALAGPALVLALQSMPSTSRDTALYESTYQAYRSFRNNVQAGQVKDEAAVAWATDSSEILINGEWLERTKRDNQSMLDKLEVELKGYTTNLIKESIRMGHRDLARFQYLIGDLTGAINNYTRCREYCTTSQHVLELSLGVVEVSLALNNYQLTRNYVVKAETVLDAAPGTGSAKDKGKQPAVKATNLPGMVAPAPNPIEAQKERDKAIVREKLGVANGISLLGTGNYSQAARCLTDIGREVLDADGASHVTQQFIPLADIALYATLTGLATFTRSEIRTRLLDNVALRPMLDLEPFLRDLLNAFYSNQFKTALTIIEANYPRFNLDIHIGPHVLNLVERIRQLAVISYVAPYSSISFDKMAMAFGWDLEALKYIVIDLIKRGELKARVDERTGTLREVRREERREAFKKALKDGEDLQQRTIEAQLRMQLLGADILVKGPKGALETY